MFAVNRTAGTVFFTRLREFPLVRILLALLSAALTRAERRSRSCETLFLRL
jgi:hypothetical protein